MVVDSTGVRPFPYENESIVKIPHPTNVEKLSTFRGVPGLLRQHVRKHRIVSTSLTNMLRNQAFASKCTGKFPIE